MKLHRRILAALFVLALSFVAAGGCQQWHSNSQASPMRGDAGNDKTQWHSSGGSPTTQP